ncbi:hypothetical protein F4802DRAFT_566956 [Xylaria palmicola]|nr:hypothetical protein F4802DRAFT_566956 [Xylaria palmicola]
MFPSLNNNITYDTLPERMNIDSLQSHHSPTPPPSSRQAAGGSSSYYHGESGKFGHHYFPNSYRQSVPDVLYHKMSAKKAQQSLVGWCQLYLIPGAVLCC